MVRNDDLPIGMSISAYRADLDERKRLAAEVEKLTTQRDVLAAALAGELRPDGHVRGCPQIENSDKPHNLRCTQVRAALSGIEGIEI